MQAVDIKALNAEIEMIVQRENRLRTLINAIIAEIEGDVLMSDLEKLISELCQNGLKSFRLGDLCQPISNIN
jgi:hypothetical protein